VRVGNVIATRRLLAIPAALFGEKDVVRVRFDTDLVDIVDRRLSLPARVIHALDRLAQGRLVTKNTVTPAARADSTKAFTPCMGVAAVLRVHSSSFQFSNGGSNVSWKSMLLTTVSSTSRMTATGRCAASSCPGITLHDVSSMKPGRSWVASA